MYSVTLGNGSEREVPPVRTAPLNEAAFAAETTHVIVEMAATATNRGLLMNESGRSK
jgi:hypothetical protein